MENKFEIRIGPSQLRSLNPNRVKGTPGRYYDFDGFGYYTKVEYSIYVSFSVLDTNIRIIIIKIIIPN